MKARGRSAALALALAALALPGARAEGPASPATGPGGPAAVLPLGPEAAIEDLQAAAYEYFSNSWTVTGLPDLLDGARISPRFEVLLGGGVSVEPLAGSELRRLPSRLRKTLEEGRLPLVRQRFVLRDAAAPSGVEVSITAFAAPLPGEPSAGTADGEFLTLLEVSLANRGDGPAGTRLGFEWRPAAALELRPAAGGGRPAMALRGGKAAALLAAPGARASAEGSRLVLDLSLAARGASEIVLALPFRPIDPPPPAWAARAVDAGRLHEEAAAGWRALLARGARLALPEPAVLDTYLASIAYQFIGLDLGEPHAGEGFYDELYLRDGAYQAISLAHAGYLEEARRALEHFPAHQKESGQFVSQEGQLDANGYAIWALVEYGLIAGDDGWLERVYPALRRSVEWIRRTRAAGDAPIGPGLLPPAIADGEFLWEGKNRIVGYDLWNLRGLRSAAEAARRLGRAGEAAEMDREADGYLRAILAAADRAGVPWLPPSWREPAPPGETWRRSSPRRSSIPSTRG